MPFIKKNVKKMKFTLDLLLSDGTIKSGLLHKKLSK